MKIFTITQRVVIGYLQNYIIISEVIVARTVAAIASMAIRKNAISKNILSDGGVQSIYIVLLAKVLFLKKLLRQYLFGSFYLIGIFVAQSSFAQMIGDSATNKDAIKRFQSLPSFTTFHDNYFITGTALNESPSKYNSDIKYQISFKQLLYRQPVLFPNSYVFFSYTQKSFWDIYRNSKPFSEINFNPAIGLMRPYNTKNGQTGMVLLMLEHESNGRDSIQSRSWNFLSGTWRQNMSPRLQLSAKAWIPFAYKDDNPDLLHYVGLFQLGGSWIIVPNKWYADLTVKKGNQWNWKGSIQGQLYYKPFKNGNQFIGAQWFQGYGENLIEYDKRTSMLRIGLIIKPNLMKFFY